MSSKCTRTVADILQDIEDAYRCVPHSIDRHNLLLAIENHINTLRAGTVQDLKVNGKLSK